MGLRQLGTVPHAAGESRSSGKVSLFSNRLTWRESFTYDMSHRFIRPKMAQKKQTGKILNFGWGALFSAMEFLGAC